MGDLYLPFCTAFRTEVLHGTSLHARSKSEPLSSLHDVHQANASFTLSQKILRRFLCA